MAVKKVLKMIEENDVKYVDFRFCDTRGKEQHVTFPAHSIDEDTFEEGNMFDGSSIAGWKHIKPQRRWQKRRQKVWCATCLQLSKCI